MSLSVALGVNLTQLTAGLANATRQIGKFGDKIQGIGAGLSLAISTPLVLAGKSALKAASDMEQAAISFEVLTKSAEGGRRVFADLQKFAADTPFEFPELAAGAKGLLAYGFSIDQLIPLLTKAGDLASGFGVDITEVTRVLGRLRAGDFGEAFERLRDFGIGRQDLEGKGLKFDSSNSYKGSVADALDAVTQIIDDKFGGMTAKQSQSISGLFSTATDAVGIFATDIGSKLIETFDLKGKLRDFTAFLDRVKDSFNALSPVAQKAIFAVGILAVVVPPILTILGTLATAIGALTLPVAAVAAGIIAAGVVIITYWDDIKAATMSLASTIQAYWNEIATTVTNSQIWQSVMMLVDSLKNFLVDAWELISSAAISAWNLLGPSILRRLEQLWVGIKILFNVGVTMIANAWESIKTIFNAAIVVISGILDVFGGIFTGNLAKIEKGAKKIVGGLWNSIIELFVQGISRVSALLASTAKSIGLDDLANTFTDSASKVSSWANQYKIAFDSVASTAKETAKTVTTAAKAITKPTNTPPGKLDFSGIKGGGNEDSKGSVGSSALGDADKLREMIRGYQTLLITSEQRRRVQEIHNKYDKDEVDIANLKVSATMKQLALDEARAARQKEINDLMDQQRIKASQPMSFGSTGVLGPNKQILQGEFNRLIGAGMAQASVGLDSLNQKTEIYQGNIQNYIQSLGMWGGLISAKLLENGTTFGQLTQAQQVGLQGLAAVGTTLIGGLEQGFQSLLQTGKFSIKGIIQSLTGLIAKLAAAAAVAFILSNLIPGAGAAGAATGAASGAANAAKGASNFMGIFKSLMGFKTGGIADGPSSGYLAMLHGKEVITPYNQAEKILSGGNGGGVQVNIYQDRFGNNYANEKQQSVNKLTSG